MQDPRSDESRLAGVAATLALVVAIALASVLFLKHLSYPLLWHDESETAMFAQRVLEYGYPKVHGEKNVVFSLWQGDGTGLSEGLDAYTGSPWAQYYFGALGVAAAARTDDLYAKTLRVRLPFALAGAAGLALLVLAVLPAVVGRSRKLVFASGFALLFAYSVASILHLREARYYGLVVLLVAAILAVHFRRATFGTLDRRLYTAILTALLVLLFLTFHPALAAIGLALGLEVAQRAWRSSPTPRVRIVALFREGLPLLLAAAAILPLLAFFDFFEQTRGWVERFSDPGTALRNAGFVAWSLLRYEFLAPALVLRGAVLGLGLAGAFRDSSRALQQRVGIGGFLGLLILVYAALIVQIPFLFERYFVVLGPIVTLVLLLDAFTLTEGLRAGGLRGAPRGVALASAGLGGILFLASVQVRVPEFAGRLQEIRRPYRGPLDFAIPYLREKYPDVEDLVIATNYEGPAYMFYLGSQVTVGFYANALERDLTIVPDVIIPRPWPEQLEILRALSESQVYSSTVLPVANLHWNNMPALSPRHGRPTAHYFATPKPVGDQPVLVLLERPPRLPD